ncbi:Oligopeptide ABC transporter, periplasmic oligopeptide-binding protein OppA [Bacillus cereus]|nr:Oligopeptide ABC transporter, periplasmic oligopeptide-binding protein OppA [Bacillus cereus]
MVPVGHVNEETGKDFRKKTEIFLHTTCKMRKRFGQKRKKNLE